MISGFCFSYLMCNCLEFCHDDKFFFRNVLTKGKYYFGKYITAYILKNKKNQNFLGFAVSVKLRKSG